MIIFSTNTTNIDLLRFVSARKIIAFALFPLILAGCDVTPTGAQETSPVSVESITVKEQPFKLQTTLPGLSDQH